MGVAGAKAEPLPRLVIDDSARDTTSKIWYALPSGFMAVPLERLSPSTGSEPEQQLEKVETLVLDAAPAEVREHYLGALRDVRAMAEYMQREEIIDCCMGMHLADDGSSAASVFTVTLQQIDWSPPKVTVLRAVASRESAANIGLLTLPGDNPASVADTLVREFSVPGQRPQDLYQCTVYVPDPSGLQLAILTLSTTAVSVRPHYRQMMEGVAYTVSFVDPMPEIERAARGGFSRVKDDIASDFG
ncbi:hypothetical protein [Streptomyces daqingensis]|nr:hypothetical protein [Streptomyces daqingensis]